jgi:hypothetical protein
MAVNTLAPRQLAKHDANATLGPITIASEGQHIVSSTVVGIHLTSVKI